MNFFLKSVLFFLAPIIFVITFIVIGLSVLSINVINNTENYKLKKNVEYIFLGDSHITHSIIDSMIPNSINLACNSEPYYYTFQKLKYITRKIKPKKVYLGFSYHNISLYYDNLINGNLAGAMPKKIFFCLDLFEKFRVINWNKNQLIVLFKNIINAALNSEDNLLFADRHIGLEGKEGIIKSHVHNRIKNQYYSENNLAGISKMNLFYFNKIISFCSKNQIEIILIKTPLHKEYDNHVPVFYKKLYEEILTKSDLELLDLKLVNLPDSSFAFDGDHVTVHGANLITNKLIEFL